MWAVYASLAAVSGTLMATLTKAALKDVDSNVVLAVESVLILLIAWGTVAFHGNLGQLGELDRRSWTYLLLAGVVTGVSSLLLYRPLKLGSVPASSRSTGGPWSSPPCSASYSCTRRSVGRWVGGGLMAAGAVVIGTASE